ncbi:MAG: aminotransferase class I/II-fold pyridoxal phosphate-dependent enzyme [Candidatus Acidiferrales bacterium]
MRFATFLLDDWLNYYKHADPPVEFDLASSTGPIWTLRELLELDPSYSLEALLDTRLVYMRVGGTKALCESIAEMEGVRPEDVQVTTGAAEALLLLFILAAEPGANVLVPSLGFPSFYEIPRGLGLEIRYYHQRRENQFRVDLDEIKKLADARTRILLVNTPHNPTGATLSEAELAALHDFSVERGIQFVCDQVYHPVYHGRRTASAARLPHAVVISDFSKALCLPGLRLGWIVDRDPRRLEQYCTAHSYFTVSGTALGEPLATLALRNREKIFARAQKVTTANLSLLDAFFSEHSGVIRWMRPQGGMTAFPWLNSGEDSRAFCTEAAQQGVLLAPGDCFSMPAHFRIGFAASGEQFPRALERLSDFIRRRLARPPQPALQGANAHVAKVG